MHNELVTFYLQTVKFCLLISKSSHLRHVEVNCTWQSVFLHLYCLEKLTLRFANTVLSFH